MKSQKDKLILLKTFYEENNAKKAKILLERNKIFHKYIRGRTNIENVFISSNSNPTEIWVTELDFDRSYELIKQLIPESKPIEIDFNGFSDEELIEILKNKDEWHDSYLIKAREEITKRGNTINENDISLHMAEKLEKIKAGKDVHPAVIFILWLSVIFAVPFLFLGFFGGIFAFIGIISAYYFWTIKIKAFNGHKYFLFKKNIRTHGKYMFFTGSIWIIAFFIKLYIHYSKIL